MQTRVVSLGMDNAIEVYGPHGYIRLCLVEAPNVPEPASQQKYVESITAAIVKYVEKLAASPGNWKKAIALAAKMGAAVPYDEGTWIAGRR